MFLDTTFCVDLMRERHRGTGGPASAKLVALGDTPLHASVFVLCELHAGARLSGDPKRETAKVERLADKLAVIYPGTTFAVAYGELEAWLRKKGKPIPTMDLLIGTMAKSHGLPLLTRDERHFTLIPGLVVETY